MTGWTYTLLSDLHGGVAALGLALLLHPAVALHRRPAVGVWTVRTAWLAALLLLAVFAAGCAAYPSWRVHLKPALVVASDPLWLRFESKEHLGAMTAALALAAAAVVQATATDRSLRPTALALLWSAFGCGVLTAALSLWVTAGVHPGW